MAQCLKVLAALAEDLSSVPCTWWFTITNIYNSSFRESDVLKRASSGTACTWGIYKHSHTHSFA